MPKSKVTLPPGKMATLMAPHFHLFVFVFEKVHIPHASILPRIETFFNRSSICSALRSLDAAKKVVSTIKFIDLLDGPSLCALSINPISILDQHHPQIKTYLIAYLAGPSHLKVFPRGFVIILPSLLQLPTLFQTSIPPCPTPTCPACQTCPWPCQ